VRLLSGIIENNMEKKYKNKSLRLGGGGQFERLKDKLAKKKGIYDPAGLAAKIGREKLGKSEFQHLATEGRKRHEK
jgi:hypothetical protein